MRTQKITKRIIFALFLLQKVKFKNKKKFIYNYTGYLILKVAPKYFFSEAFSEKMFQTKVV